MNQQIYNPDNFNGKKLSESSSLYGEVEFEYDKSSDDSSKSEYQDMSGDEQNQSESEHDQNNGNVQD